MESRAWVVSYKVKVMIGNEYWWAWMCWSLGCWASWWQLLQMLDWYKFGWQQQPLFNKQLICLYFCILHSIPSETYLQTPSLFSNYWRPTKQNTVWPMSDNRIGHPTKRAGQCITTWNLFPTNNNTRQSVLPNPVTIGVVSYQAQTWSSKYSTI